MSERQKKVEEMGGDCLIMEPTLWLKDDFQGVGFLGFFFHRLFLYSIQ